MGRFDTVIVETTDGKREEHTCSVARVSDGVLYVQDSDHRESPVCYPLINVRCWRRVER